MYTNTKYKYFTTILYRTNTKITFYITKEDMSLIMKTLDSSGAYSWDHISRKMIKICGELIIVPLNIISGQSLREMKFQEILIKAKT